MTVRDYLRVWIEKIAGTVAASTWQNYEIVVRLHLIPALGNHPLRDLTRDAVREYMIDMRRRGKSPEHCALHIAILRAALQDACDADPPLVSDNAATRLWRRVPPELRRTNNPGRHALDADMGRRILDLLAREHRSIYRIVCCYARSGMRRNEVLGLQVSDLNFRDHTIEVRRQYYGAGRIGPPKGRRPRTIDMASSLESVLVASIHESGQLARALGCALEPSWVFRSPRTGVFPWSPTAVADVLGETSLAATGHRVSPKAFRHTVATALMTAGESPRYVQLLLGHANLHTTMQYVAHRGMRRRTALDRLG